MLRENIPLETIARITELTISQLEGFATNNCNNYDRLTIPIAPKLIRQSQHSANESNIYIDRQEREIERESQGFDVDDSPRATLHERPE